MEPDLRLCLDKHEAEFSSISLHPCVDNRIEFAYDRDVANAIRFGISKVGCITSNDEDFQKARFLDEKKEVPEEGAPPANREVHFTLAAVVGFDSQEVTFATPSDSVVVEMREGSEQDFFTRGIEGPIVGRVVLQTKLKGAKHLTFETEHFFESISNRVLTHQQKSSADCIPAVRFTKTLRVSGRQGHIHRAPR